MAGAKGRSGGSRQNTGGARAGSGRKKKEPPILNISSNGDPKDFLIAVMNDPCADVRMRVDAAKSLMPFVHVKLGEGGKKDQQADAAKKAGIGRYAPRPPPRIIAFNRDRER